MRLMRPIGDGQSRPAGHRIYSCQQDNFLPKRLLIDGVTTTPRYLNPSMVTLNGKVDFGSALADLWGEAHFYESLIYSHNIFQIHVECL